MRPENSAKAARILRYVLLASILILTTVLGRLHTVNKAIPPIDSFCPFGGLESLYTVITQGMFLRRIAMGSLILLGISVVSAVIFRRAFCGKICPLGFLQEIFARVGNLLFARRKPGTAKWLAVTDKVMRYLKYAVLLYFIAITWLMGYLAIRAYDPWVAYHHLFSDELLSSYLVGFIILAISLLTSMLVERPFCRYLCPMGAFLGGISKLGLFRIKRDTNTCIDCGDCSAACPVGIKVDKLEAVKSAECLSCDKCVTACPVDGALAETLPGPSGKTLSPLLITITVLALFAGVVGATTMTGDFMWNRYGELPRTVRRIIRGPEHIREDNSLVEIVYVYKIPPQLFAREFEGLVEEDFYLTLDEAELDAEEVRNIVVEYYKMQGEGVPGEGDSCSH